MFEVNKDVPAPKPKLKGPAPIYPWRELKDGDSFFVPNITARRATSLQAIAYKILRAKGLRPANRKESDGFRFWAVAEK